MLFWNTLRKSSNKNYTCWVCLEQEEIKDKETKFNWIKHGCGCNLQIHKICYLKYLNNLMEGTYVEEIQFNRLSEGPKLFIYDVREIQLFNLIDKNKRRPKDMNRFIKMIPESIRNIVSFYLHVVKMPFIVFNSQPLEAIFTDRFQRGAQDFPNIPEEKCPQCKKEFFPGPTNFIKGSSKILSIYFKIEKLIEQLVPIGLGVALLSNPPKLLLKLGLYQLRTLFPESILRTVLNMSSTKALDVYSETFNGIHSITKFNKFIVMGLPYYLLTLVKNHNSLFDISAFIIDDFEFMYPFLFMLHLRSYEDAPLHTIKLTNNCILLTKLALYIYRGIFKRLYQRDYYKKWLKENNVTPGSNLKDRTQEFKDRNQNQVGITSRLLFKYYCSITSYADEIVRAVFIWPAFSKLFSDNVLEKLIPFFNFLPSNWFKYTSPDEVKMCMNFTSYGIMGFVYFVSNAWLSKQRIIEISKINKIVDRVIADEDDDDDVSI
ncbi:hypothetical protein C6P45_004962 [Maudiozyma exigua]|uniref:Uncharacterized protein n=1 Tax=Maudiozyma exigua TaxID=34358 RepID=A0A9P6WAB2_MAUEX|nr:hypothetical protein C6P45_004962 [Kazachstania exigua]